MQSQSKPFSFSKISTSLQKSVRKKETSCKEHIETIFPICFSKKKNRSSGRFSQCRYNNNKISPLSMVTILKLEWSPQAANTLSIAPWNLYN